MSQVIPRHINLPHMETKIKRIKYATDYVLPHIICHTCHESSENLPQS